ncbi:MAG: hypothetical protein OXC14_18200, partial [Rhodospirillaceae bacterium]|nr:hypothetical protein [Rhodospirillaceae bacterium]
SRGIPALGAGAAFGGTDRLDDAGSGDISGVASGGGGPAGVFAEGAGSSRSTNSTMINGGSSGGRVFSRSIMIAAAAA